MAVRLQGDTLCNEVGIGGAARTCAGAGLACMEAHGCHVPVGEASQVFIWATGLRCAIVYLQGSAFPSSAATSATLVRASGASQSRGLGSSSFVAISVFRAQTLW